MDTETMERPSPQGQWRPRGKIAVHQGARREQLMTDPEWSTRGQNLAENSQHTIQTGHAGPQDVGENNEVSLSREHDSHAASDSLKVAK